MEDKKGQLKFFTILVLVLMSVFVVAAVVSEKVNQTSAPQQELMSIDNSTDELVVNNLLSNKTEPKLAEVVDGKSIHTEYYDNDYSQHFNLSKISYEKINNNALSSASLKIGNKMDWIKGFEINKEQYAIHLVGCNKQKKTCNFRVNGISFRDLSEGTLFDLNNGHTIKIKSIKIEFCDNKFVCDYMFDSYDLVEIEVFVK